MKLATVMALTLGLAINSAWASETDDLKSQIAALKSAVGAAEFKAEMAAESAAKAEEIANVALKTSEDTNRRLEEIYDKLMNRK